MSYKAIVALNAPGNETSFDLALDDLIERNLLFFDTVYDLHPIVRQYAYDRLTDKQGVHTRLKVYFAAEPVPDHIESANDLRPVIELFHHTVGAQQYAPAYGLYRDRLQSLLYYRFGEYRICIELLKALVDGRSASGELINQDSYSLIMNELANCYSLTGQSRCALEMYRSGLTVGFGKAPSATVLGNMADDHLKLGELRTAEQILLRRLEECRVHSDESGEALTWQDIGRLYSHLGRFREGEDALRRAIKLFDRLESGEESESLTYSYLALHFDLAGEPAKGVDYAHRALEIAIAWRCEHDRIEAVLRLARAFLGVACRTTDAMRKTEALLRDAIGNCRRIRLVELEPDILLTYARWYEAAGDVNGAQQYAQEALGIAARCEYRLAQADVCLYLAELSLVRGEKETAQIHGEHARLHALCDGGRYSYRPVRRRAEALLGTTASD